MRTGVIIVAGGRGERMGGSVPKQYLPLLGKPVLVHTVERFGHALHDADIIVAVAAEYTDTWERMASAYQLRCRACEGGGSRFDSVRNALKQLEDCDVIMVHDGVRPLVSRELITRMADAAREYGAAVPAIEPVDSFRATYPGGQTRPVDRAALRAVQTPQAFSAEILKKAYTMEYDPAFTDDATVVENAGFGITLIRGERQNFKMTTPEDLKLAQLLMESGF